VDALQSLVSMVEQKTGLDRVAAERATRATVDAFFERLSGGEARDLAKHLPPDFVRPAQVLPERRPEPFHLDGFLARVADKAEVDPQTAEEYAEVVLTVLRVMVGADEYAEAVAQLPADYQDLIAATQRPHVEVRSTIEFLARVADRTGLGMPDARRVTEVVLETLGERIPPPAVTRLTSQLPGQLREAISRGAAQTTAPRKLGAETFVRLVAEREDATPQQAQGHTQAVLGTVAAAVPEQEFYDTVVLQLPNDYADLLVPR
jgi:uncharacterized protein (DUF2267 family)